MLPDNVPVTMPELPPRFVVIPFAFSFTALGHAERYIPAEKAAEKKEILLS